MVAQKTHPLRLLSRPSTVKLYWHLRSRSLSNYLTADYNPSKTAAGIAGGLYIMASLLLLARLVLARSWWGLCLPISAISTFCFAPPYFLLNNPPVTGTGFFVRIALTSSPNAIGLFAISQLFIIVTPAGFLAYNYILYGRFIVNCVDPKYSLIRPDRVARIFVCSDIITFLVQACSLRSSTLLASS